MRPGWAFARLKDYSDFEWSSWTFFFSSSWKYLFLHFVISELLRKYWHNFVQYWYIIVSLTYVSEVFGMKQLVAVITQPTVFAFLIFSGGGKLAIWVIFISILVIFNFLKYKNIFWSVFDYENINDEEIYLLFFGLGWIGLRCISFCINYVDMRKQIITDNDDKTRRLSENLVAMFSYVLYLPTLYTGPIILYEDFAHSFKVTSNVIKIKVFLKDMMIYLLYTILLDLAFHYIYFLAMMDQLQVR